MANEAITVPPIDGGRLSQDQRVAPSRPHPSQDQPQHTVGPSKASIGTRQDGQLVAQVKRLEQEVSTRRQPKSDRSEDRHDALHRA